MTGWDMLDKLLHSFPPLMMALILATVLAALIIFIIGFSKHGLNFLKYGFKQNDVAFSLDKRFDELLGKIGELDTRLSGKIDELDARLSGKIDELDTRLSGKISELDARLSGKIGRLDTKIEAIETNHFGHLKNFLTELTSILLDKNIINNQDKARLDNQLRDIQPLDR